ncbi:MAG: hypothetical protein QOE90_848 [Thermoplasmata archaeon]|nr:hypothetical protein [Thermoplasmata archaeon]
MPKPAFELHAANVIPYLMARGVLGGMEVLDAPDLEVEDRSRRNRNLRITFGDGTGLLVKQAKSAEGDATAREAMILRSLEQDHRFARAWPSLPALVDFDPEQRVIVTRLIHPATTLTKYHLNLGDVQFSASAGLITGALLGDLHGARGPVAASAPRPDPAAERPLALRMMTAALEAGVSSREVTHEFLDALEETGVLALLPALTSLWQERDDLVHGDIRWDNVLVTPADDEREFATRLIDWELALVGDQAYDVACYLAEYARFSLVVAGARNLVAAQDVHETLRAIRPAENARAFLDAYAAARGLTPAQRREHERRAARYVPTILAMIAWEQSSIRMMRPGERTNLMGEVALAWCRDAVRDPAAWMRGALGVALE